VGEGEEAVWIRKESKASAVAGARGIP